MRPEEIRQMEEEVDKLYQEVYGQRGTITPEPQGENDEGSEEIPAQHTNENQQASEQDISETESQQQQHEDWEHKYRVLQGKYNKEIAELRDKLETSSSVIQALEEKVQRLESKLVNETTAKAETQSKLQSIFSDPSVAQLREYYPEVWDALVKVVNGIDSEYSSKFESVRKFAEETTNQAVRKASQETFYSKLERLVPGWEKINTDPEFLEWLAVEDVYTGLTRHDLLLNAFHENEPERVAVFFKEFIDQRRQHSQQQPPKKVLPRNAGTRVPNITTPPPMPEIIPGSEVKKFYNDVRKGLYRGREDEMRKLELKYDKAMAEGRIDPNK